MVERRVLLAWACALATSTLLVASLTGDGRGPFGFAALSGLLWSYVLVGLGIAVALALSAVPARGAGPR